MMRPRILLSIFVPLVLATGGLAWLLVHRSPQTFYASPSGSGDGCSRREPCSLATAQEKVRTANTSMARDLRVILDGGVYELKEPLVFEPADSGTNDHWISFQASPGETPVLSGGQPLRGWVDAGGGLYQAPSGGMEFRQLYVNGQRAIRARTPNRENDADMGPYLRLLKWDLEGRRIQIPAANIGNWLNLPQVEMVVQSHWHLYRFRIDRIETEGERAWVYPLSPERDEPAFGQIAQLDPNGKPEEQESFYFENALEFLDAPGEWVLEPASQVVYYRPRPGEDMRSAEVIAPRLETLLEIRGTEQKPVTHLRIEGITFEYSTWRLPSRQGYAPWQAALMNSSGLGGPFPGIVQIQNAENISFEGNTLRHTGMHGLVTLGKTLGITIDHNLFEDISGGAVMLDVIANRSGGSVGDRISNNTIRTAGRDYSDACGIWASFPQRLVIEHNELSDLPYTGISLGWSWDTSPTAARENLIQHNHIYRVMQKHDDGAGIYILGNQPGTRILENYIHDLAFAPFAGSYPLAGVYLDEGSDNLLLGHQLIVQVPRGQEVNLYKTGLNLQYQKPVLLTPDSPEGKALIRDAGPAK